MKKKTNYYNATTETWFRADVIGVRGRARDLDVYTHEGYGPTRMTGIPEITALEPDGSGWSDIDPSTAVEPEVAATEPPLPEEAEGEDDQDDDQEDEEPAPAFSDLTVVEAKENVDAETEVEVLEAWHSEEMDGKERVTLLSHIEARIEELQE